MQALTSHYGDIRGETAGTSTIRRHSSNRRFVSARSGGLNFLSLFFFLIINFILLEAASVRVDSDKTGGEEGLSRDRSFPLEWVTEAPVHARGV